MKNQNPGFLPAIAAAVLISGAILAHDLFTRPTQPAPAESFYPAAWIVTSRDDSSKYVQLMDPAGAGLAIFAEDLFVGDIVIGTKSDNGTPNDFTDDRVVETRWSGYSLEN